LFRYELGFSQVIEILIEQKKPMVGHNMFLDMLFMYSQFIGVLPKTLIEF
jgi:poly(A)-specific ribonuclease